MIILWKAQKLWLKISEIVNLIHESLPEIITLMMKSKTDDKLLKDIQIRTNLKTGDIGYLTYLHGILYSKEFGFNLFFESFVAESFSEFYRNHNPQKDRVWICEEQGKIIGSLFLVDRNDSAQLRYFLIQKEYRGIGLGKLLMKNYMKSFMDGDYSSSYLWTVDILDSAASLYQRYGFELSEEFSSTRFGVPLKEQKYVLKTGRTLKNEKAAPGIE